MIGHRSGERAMPWWGWIVCGVVLLVGEMIADAQFYLIFLGAAAVIVGVLGFAGLSGGIAMQWAIFGVLSVVLLVAFRARVYGRMRGAGADAPGHENIVGEIAIVRSDIGPGVLGRAELRGADWTARNVGTGVLHHGERAEVVKVAGLVIDVRRAE
jgi:membrane protein implicated in regulation of membrane protease activity